MAIFFKKKELSYNLDVLFLSLLSHTFLLYAYSIIRYFQKKLETG